MTEDAETFELGRFYSPLSVNLMRYLSQQLELRFRVYPGDPVVAHFDVVDADEASVKLLCAQLDDNSGFGIFLRGVSNRAHILMQEYQPKVDQAIAGLTTFS